MEEKETDLKKEYTKLHERYTEVRYHTGYGKLLLRIVILIAITKAIRQPKTTHVSDYSSLDSDKN